MHRDRFEFALERVGPGDWERFEHLASAFLVVDWGELRTMATPSGDEGRDAELFSPTDDPSVFIQYSVTTAWDAKIRDTANKITKNFPGQCTVLVYATSQKIGADGDKLRASIRKKHGFMVDIRDRYWFLDRVNTDPARQESAEHLAEALADPVLPRIGLERRRVGALSSAESLTALLHLELAWADEVGDKNLTRVCFDALVTAALSGTTADTRMSRDEVRARVRDMLASHTSAPERLVDNALQRLAKKRIRYWQSEDSFCLTADEAKRLADSLAIYQRKGRENEADVRAAIQNHAAGAGLTLQPSDEDALLVRVSRILEAYLFRIGERFATAISTGEDMPVVPEDFREVVVSDASKHPKSTPGDDPEVAMRCAREILDDPGAAAQEHLRSLADAYTLWAFLHEAPDVQAVMRKLFSFGELWLDATLCLPLFAEQLVPEERRRFTALLRSARSAGMKLWITPGVVEELERHLNRCLAYARIEAGVWEGRVPFLCSVFVGSGRDLSRLPVWIELFRGHHRPEDDVALHLQATHGVNVKSLADDAERLDDDARQVVSEFWTEVHTSRRGKGVGFDTTNESRLIDHDIENYAGVLGRRRDERTSPLGYESWWLTMDRAAFRAHSRLVDSGHRQYASPAMSPDFLVRYLSFGPNRGAVGAARGRLPVAVDAALLDSLPKELMDLAKRIRSEAQDLPEQVIQRRVRDAMDRAKRKPGAVVRRGLEGVEQDLLKS